MLAVSHTPAMTGRFVVKQDTQTIQEPKQHKRRLFVMRTQPNDMCDSKANSVNNVIPSFNATPLCQTLSNSKDVFSVNSQSHFISQKNKLAKRFKIQIGVILDSPLTSKFRKEKKNYHKHKGVKEKHKKQNKGSMFNCGRWQPEEHHKFIEAILRFGNEWKQVQKFVGTRSSTQARSHAQKFFMKVNKSDFLNFQVDLSRNSIKALHNLANRMSKEEYSQIIQMLNCAAFSKKENLKSKKKDKDNGNKPQNSMEYSDIGLNDTFHMNGESIFSLKTQEHSSFLTTERTTSSPSPASSSYSMSVSFEDEHGCGLQSQINPIANSKVNLATQEGNNFIINNNFNTFNYLLNFSNCEKKDHHLLKRSVYQEGGVLTALLQEGPSLCKKNFDEKEYIDNFNFTFKEEKFDNKNEFNVEKEFEDAIMLDSNINIKSFKSYSIDQTEHFPFDLMRVSNLSNLEYSNNKEINGIHKTNATECEFFN